MILSIVRLESPVYLITSSFIAFLLFLKMVKTENSYLDNSPFISSVLFLSILENSIAKSFSLLIYEMTTLASLHKRYTFFNPCPHVSTSLQRYNTSANVARLISYSLI